jgi:hypothetical protein
VTYKVEQEALTREPFGEYWYRIYKGERLIARYWHDNRGDDHGIEFSNGGSESWPVGRMLEFLEGGGESKPKTLSAKAVAYLDAKDI